VRNTSHEKVIGWLRQFICRYKEGLVRSRDIFEHSEIQVDDNDKENVPE
jgi:hypothetical protein